VSTPTEHSFEAKRPKASSSTVEPKNSYSFAQAQPPPRSEVSPSPCEISQPSPSSVGGGAKAEECAPAQAPLSPSVRQKIREQAATEARAAEDRLDGLAWDIDAGQGEESDEEGYGDGGRGGIRVGGKRKGVSKEEKEKLSRERNREHARNTRLRKKAYVANLSKLVLELSSQQEVRVREKGVVEARELERSGVREGVLRKLLAFHGSGERDVYKWQTILDDDFLCVMPITPFRSVRTNEIEQEKSSRVIRGIDAMVADVCSLEVCVEAIGCPTSKWKAMRANGSQITASYDVPPGAVHQLGDQAMARWVLGTRNAVAGGALCECSVPGMLCCTFTDQNKVLSCEFVFDVMSFMQQLQCASSPDTPPPQPSPTAASIEGSSSEEDFLVEETKGDEGEEKDEHRGGGFAAKRDGAKPALRRRREPVVAHTLEMATCASEEARIVTSAAAPFAVVHANAAWEELCGFTQGEVVGKPCSFLQGPGTDLAEVARFMKDVRANRPSSMMVVNYKKEKQPFKNFLRAYPLTSSKDSTEVTHFLSVQEELPSEELSPLAPGPSLQQLNIRTGMSRTVSRDPAMFPLESAVEAPFVVNGSEVPGE